MASTPLIIYTYPNNYRVQKALIAGRYNEIEVNETIVNMEAKEHKSEQFLAKFPVGKVPAMDTPFGPLFESGAIAKYVARLRPDTGLMGINFYQAAQIEQWIDFCSFELEVPRGQWIGQILGYRPQNQAILEESRTQVKAALEVLNKYLLSRTYMVGNQPTLADIVLVTALRGLFEMVLTKEVRDSYPNVMRWFDTCVHQKEFADVLGTITFCTEEKKPGEMKSAPAATEKKEDQGKKGKDKGKKEAWADKDAKAAAEDKPKEEAKKEDGGKKNKGKQSKKDDKPAEDKPKEETPKKEEGGNKKGKGNKGESGKKEEPKAEDKPKEDGGKKGKQQSKKDDKPAEEKPKEETPKKQEGGNKKGGKKEDAEATPRKESKAEAPKTEEKPKKQDQPKKEETPKKQEGGKKESGKQESGKKESGKKEGQQQQQQQGGGKNKSKGKQ